MSLLCQTCIDFQCVNASALLPNLNCDAQTTCNGQGVRRKFPTIYFSANDDIACPLHYDPSFRYAITKGTATVRTGGPHLTVTSQGKAAA